MADSKNSYFKQAKFAGTIMENIEEFLKRFERTTIINGRIDTKKSQYIIIYLEEVALSFYSNIHYSIDLIKW